MAHEQTDDALSNRLLSVAAVGLLASAAAIAFGRVFQGHTATLKLVGAALLSVGIAALLERRGPLLAVLGSAVGLVVAAGVFVYPKTTFAGFPTFDTFRAFGHAMDHVGQQARVQVAPTPPLQPLLLAALTAVWTAAFAAHALAVRSGSPLLAALPPGSLVAFADILLDDGARPAYAALFLAAALAVLFMDGLRRVRQWGPLRPWPSHRGRARLASTTATRGARRVTVAALGAALLLPGLLPGFQSPALLKLEPSAIAGNPSINPFVSITSSLKRDHPRDLFLVRSQQPSYWRWLSLDQFDGNGWTTDDLDVDNGRVVEAGERLPESSIAGTGLDVRSADLYQTVVVLSDTDDPWLPMAYQPENVTVGQSSIRYDPETASAVPEVGMQEGLSYTVRSQLVLPTRAQLESVTADELRSSAYATYRQLPADTPLDIYTMAHRITRSDATPFEQVMAIQDFLRTKFQYDDRVSGDDIGTLSRFLTVSRRGFCQQFSTAMAVLVRALGYPSRVAVGFTQGTYDPKARGWRVSTINAHAWPEVLFPGFGWMAFEPTPTRDNPVADTYIAPGLKTQTICELQGTCGGNSSNTKAPNGKLGQQRALINRERGQPANTGTLRLPKPGARRGPAHPYRLPVLLLLFALLALAAILVIVLPVVKAVVRRVRMARAGPPREVVLSTYRSFSGSAADLGLGRAQGETLREFRDRLRREVRFSDGHLHRLTAIVDRAAYSEQDVTTDDASEAVSSARRALKEMRRSTPVGRRLLGVFRPGL
jgi:hypothetical protein